MKRLILIVEGDTEKTFVDEVLCPYLYSLGIYNSVQCFKTKHSNGGMSKYSYIKRDIINVLYEDNVIVSTLLDFYRLPSDFPYFDESKKMPTHQKQVSFLEEKVKEDIEMTQNKIFDNLIPYIQLHEFEALIFSSIDGTDALFDRNEYKYKSMMDVINEFPNPEDINNGPNTAPSVRLKEIIPGYKKVLYGKSIIQEIGMDTILCKCPRFSEWVEKIKTALQ